MTSGKLVSGIMLTLLLGSMFFSAIMLAEGEDVHDLVVSLKAQNIIFRDGRGHLSSGNSTVLNATVFNNGTLDEVNVTLQLLINGSEVFHSWTPKLLRNQTFWSAYLWTPEDGTYNVTAYSPPVENETFTTNNNDTGWVWVCPPQAPIANFTFEPEVPPNIVIVDKTVTFNASASHDDLDWGTILNYTWDFGDNTTGTGMISNHNFTGLGNFNVNLTVRDTENLTGWTNRTVIVDKYPIARFGVSNPSYCKPPLNVPPYYVNRTLKFDASTSSPDGGSIVNYRWDFGDGNITTVPDSIIYHFYNMTGNYDVNLTVTDNLNLNGSWVLSVRVETGYPNASFTIQPSPYYANEPLIFNASLSYDPDNYTAPNHGIDKYTWDFGDNTTGTGMIISHTYAWKGNYNVTLTVTDYEGYTDDESKNISVSLRVIMQVEEYGNTTIVHNPEETFNVNINISNVENLYSFYFKLSWPTPWMPPGWLDLFDPDSVMVTYGGFLGPKQDQAGQLRIKWEPIPRADEGYVIVNATLLVNEPRSGNGTLARVTFKVAAPGNCTLKLSETILSKSFKSITPITHKVENGTFYTTKPVADFWEDTHSPPVDYSVKFDASESYDPDSPTNGTNRGILNYTWDFGDGNVTTTPDPIIYHAYTKLGIYYVNLTVTDDDGENLSYRDPSPKVVGEVIHDIAIVKIENPTPVDCYNGRISMFNINITLRNEGNVQETFNVAFYYDSYIINNNTTVTLSQGNQTQLIFSWNVTSVTKGKYIISAYAWPVPGENDTADNTRTCEQKVGIGMEGDCNGDGTVDIFDIVIVGMAFGSRPSYLNWNEIADLVEKYGEVDIFDLVTVGTRFGYTDP